MIVKNREVKPFEVKSIAGAPLVGVASRKILSSTKGMVLAESFGKKGTVWPLHKHPERESVGYLVSGKLKMTIGGKEYILEPGDSWVHPFNVEHRTEHLEDSVFIEVFSPPGKD